MNELTQRKRFNTILLATGLGSVAMFVVLLFCGTVDIPASEIWAVMTGGEHSEIAEMIVRDLRMPMACCAFLSGMALSVAGLLLQTTFNNPLAGPSVLGVSTGASLGVAVITLLLGGGAAVGFDSYVGSLFGAIVGAGVMLLLLLGFSKIVKGTAMLLIVGILLPCLIGYIHTEFLRHGGGCSLFRNLGPRQFCGGDSVGIAVLRPDYSADHHRLCTDG
jgi:iron complex transport system permease protein